MISVFKPVTGRREIFRTKLIIVLFINQILKFRNRRGIQDPVHPLPNRHEHLPPDDLEARLNIPEVPPRVAATRARQETATIEPTSRVAEYRLATSAMN